MEALPKFFKMIYDTARSIKPDALVEFCPCGTSFNFFTLPNLNMSVASDPHNSWQVRTKGKTLKALHGDAIAYFGDHVELSDGRQDFASTLGIGGVVGTQFTWPPGSAQRNRLDLTPDKEEIWQKWVASTTADAVPRRIPRRAVRHRLRPAGGSCHPKVRQDVLCVLRAAVEGPDRTARPREGSYRIVDYENDKELGIVRGPTAAIDVEFEKHLLIRADPE